MIDNIIPRSNSIWEETTHVSRRATSYFSTEYAYTNDVQIRIPILIPHSLERLVPCHVPVTEKAAWY